MDDRVKRAIARWPNVPAAYGWLSLDVRGRWRLEGGIVRNRATREAIGRNYLHDGEGRWYYQNGPQRAYVTLEYTPWVYVLDGAGALHTHTGLPVESTHRVFLDEELVLLLLTEHGIGVVSDRDAGALLDRLCDANGRLLDAEEVERRLLGAGPDDAVNLWFDPATRLPLERIARAEVAKIFGFDPNPREETP